MKDGAPAFYAAMMRQWHMKKGVNLFGSQPENTPNRNLIESLWSQMKQPQNKEHNVIFKVESMLQRIKMILNTKKRHTKY